MGVLDMDSHIPKSHLVTFSFFIDLSFESAS